MRRGPMRRSGRRAVTLVETAVVISVCVLFLFAVFEYGRVVMMRQVVDNAAREGARLAVISPSSVDLATATANVRTQVTNYLAGQPLDNLNIQIYKADAAGNIESGAWTDAPLGHNILVEVTGDYRPMLPTFGFLPDPVPIRVQCLMRSEVN
jgi:Flp pilus assembly protein TadG